MSRPNAGNFQDISPYPAAGPANKILRPIGSGKKPVPAKNELVVAQQGTGPFGNEFDPHSYPSLETWYSQNRRLRLLVLSASLLVSAHVL